MNKTLLLIIVDFLFLNLIALTRWEKAEPTRPQRTPATGVVANAPAKDQDLVETMRLSLEDERAARTQMVQQLATVESTLSQRNQNLAQLQTERTRLAATLGTTQQQAAELDQKLAAVAHDAAVSKERLAQLQRELEAKQAEAARQKEQLTALEQAQGEARQKIEGLSVAVKVAEQEKQLLRQTADTFKQQAETERQERQKVQATTVQLAQGVGQLAEKSGELTKEIRDNRPINSNVLFNDFLANRVSAKLTATRDSLLGQFNRNRDASTVFVTDGQQVYALLHLDDTPFDYQDPVADWKRITVEFSRDPAHSSATTLQFLSLDPRIVALPVDATQVAALGVKVYRLAADPFKFPEAMLVSHGGAGYGEVPFKLDAKEPGYVRMDRNLFKRLAGTFTPSRGDLVFSRSGELIGLMVSSSYCAIVNNFLPARSLTLGDLNAQDTNTLLADMASRYRGLPFRLQ
jgi:X-X-X-Leu-X-X-Gly heptad repeat protein